MIETTEKFYMVKCANCGKDVEIGERPEEKCYWCHKPALKKEGNMVAEIKASELKPETIKKLGIDKIIADSELRPSRRSRTRAAKS